MQSDVLLLPPEPFNDCVALNYARSPGEDEAIRGVFPTPKIVSEFVFLGILVDISDDIPKLSVACDHYTPDRMLE